MSTTPTNNGGPKEHDYTDEITCPHCDYAHLDSWELTPNEDELQCSTCGKLFIYTRNIAVSYSTKPIAARNQTTK